MSIVFEPAPPEVHALAGEVIAAWHPHLKRQGFKVRLCILMASQQDESTEPALKDNGYPVAAMVKVIPYKSRVDDRKDAEFTIDARRWDELSPESRRALLDHCLTALEIQTDENGFVQTDDFGRPKLRLRLCDWNLRGYREVARRHGEHALEVQAVRQFQDQFGDVMEAGEKLLA